MRKIIVVCLGCLLALGVGSCTEFLELKPDAKISTPETYTDLRALMSHEQRLNRYFIGLVEMGIDDYYLPATTWASRTAFDQDIYLWKPEPKYLLSGTNSFWVNVYKAIATVNVVLETLERNKLEDSDIGRELKGEALFYRSLQFFYLTQVYAPVYNAQRAASDYGIVLRMSSAIDQQTTRASLAECYAQIIKDLLQAVELLPEQISMLTRASRLAAQAALSRVYLAMGDYAQALLYADRVLAVHPALMDFNKVNVNSRNPFPVAENPELLYFGSSASGSSLLAISRANVDTLLYRSYHTNDLRKTAFFSRRTDGYYSFKGFYTGAEVSYFAGLATSELYLIKAECLMRAGQLQQGMDVLNQLLLTRWKAGTYNPYEVTDKLGSLKILYAERRKELMRRGIRWMDLKRLNKEPDFAKTLTRKMLIDGKEELFELPPNDLRYVYLIPEEVIQFTGIPQNPR